MIWFECYCLTKSHREGGLLGLIDSMLADSLASLLEPLVPRFRAPQILLAGSFSV